MFHTRIRICQHIYTVEMSKDAIDDIICKGQQSQCIALIVTGGHDSVLSMDPYNSPVEILSYQSVNNSISTEVLNFDSYIDVYDVFYLEKSIFQVDSGSKQRDRYTYIDVYAVLYIFWLEKPNFQVDKSFSHIFTDVHT